LRRHFILLCNGFKRKEENARMMAEREMELAIGCEND
jgi:hypothetical protein